MPPTKIRENNDLLDYSSLKSPRAAAIAGIVFSLLLTVSMFLLREFKTINPTDISQAWLDDQTLAVNVALGIIPFAGIALLYFTGVIRDWLGDREDRLFSTIFQGSGIIFIAILFVWATAIGSIFHTYSEHITRTGSIDNYIFGAAFTDRILSVYGLRVAGSYMMAICTLGRKTKLFPLWMTIITYSLAIGFLVFPGIVPETKNLFPGWVFVVSLYIFITNLRQREKTA